MHIQSIKWRTGFQSRVDAETAYKEIEKIRAKKGGTATAADLVEAAKSRRSKLHSAFDWDEVSESSENREHFARTMIRAIEVIYVEAPNSPMPLYQPVIKKAHHTQQAQQCNGLSYWRPKLGGQPIS